MPTASDLVTDLPADFEVFGQAVDTSLADLKGGTTGQVLAKATNADMDFTWTNGGDITGVTAGTGISGGGTSGDVTITNSMATAIDAKGDLIAGTAADTFSRLAVGTTGQVLTADSAEATGIKWATPSGAATIAQIATGTLTSGTSVTISGLSSYDWLSIIAYNIDPSASSNFQAQINAVNTGNLYEQVYLDSTSSTNYQGGYSGNYISFDAYANLSPTTIDNYFVMKFTNCKSAGFTQFETMGYYTDASTAAYHNGMNSGIFKSANTVSSIKLTLEGATTFQGGTYYVFGG